MYEATIPGVIRVFSVLKNTTSFLPISLLKIGVNDPLMQSCCMVFRWQSLQSWRLRTGKLLSKEYKGLENWLNFVCCNYSFSSHFIKYYSFQTPCLLTLNLNLLGKNLSVFHACKDDHMSFCKTQHLGFTNAAAVTVIVLHSWSVGRFQTVETDFS